MTLTTDTAAAIESLIETWRERFADLNAEAAHAKPAPERWSISEVVGHLIDSACNNHQRFVRAQNLPELVFPKYDQNEWVAAADYRSCAWDTIVSLWYNYNGVIATLIRNIPEDRLATPCTIPPYETCKLGYLVTDYLDHLNHHFAILDRRMNESNDG